MKEEYELSMIQKLRYPKMKEKKPATNTTEEKKIEHLAMNIVYQIGDALDNKIKDGIDIVSARQITNDICIDFVKDLLNELHDEIKREVLKDLDYIFQNDKENLTYQRIRTKYLSQQSSDKGDKWVWCTECGKEKVYDGTICSGCQEQLVK